MEFHNSAVNEEKLRELQKYLHEHAGLTLLELIGIFTALACSPTYIAPATWMELLGFNQGYANDEEACSIQETILALYEHTANELKCETYTPGMLNGLQELEWPPAKIKNYYLFWGKGFIQCMDGIWQDQENPEHAEAYALLSELVTSIRTLYDNENQIISDHDFDIVQTHVKGIYDYWVEQRGDFNEQIH